MPLVSGHLRGIAFRPGKRREMIAPTRSFIHPSAGVDGDFGRRPGRAQITVLSEEAWRAACEDVGVMLPWTLRRANLLIAGIPLQPLAGSRIIIGPVILEVTGKAAPCRRMDEAHEGLRKALIPQARGGVRCRVLAGGAIAVDDVAFWQAAMGDLFETLEP